MLYQKQQNEELFNRIVYGHSIHRAPYLEPSTTLSTGGVVHRGPLRDYARIDGRNGDPVMGWDLYTSKLMDHAPEESLVEDDCDVANIGTDDAVVLKDLPSTDHAMETSKNQCTNLDAKATNWTHFLAIPMCTSDLLEPLQEFRRSLLLRCPRDKNENTLDWTDPKMQRAIMPSNKSHLTLLMLRLPDDRDIKTAIKEIQEAVDAMDPKHLSQCAITLRDVSAFSRGGVGKVFSDVVYTGIDPRSQDYMSFLLDGIVPCLSSLSTDGSPDASWLKKQHIMKDRHSGRLKHKQCHMTLMNTKYARLGKQRNQRALLVDVTDLLVDANNTMGPKFSGLSIKVDELYLCRLNRRDNAPTIVCPSGEAFGYTVDGVIRLKVS